MTRSATPLTPRLQSRAYQELRRLIVSGEFPPGTFLSERQVALQLQMSKTPVHVALEKLEAEGFVTISAQQGVVVRGMSMEDILDHYELREAIECWAVRKIAGRLSVSQEELLRMNLTNQQSALKAMDLTALMLLDGEMHCLICSFLKNREITTTMERLRDKIHQVIVLVVDNDKERPPQSVAEHAAIIHAVLSGDGGQASELVRAHLAAGKQRILNPYRFSAQ